MVCQGKGWFEVAGLEDGWREAKGNEAGEGDGVHELCQGFGAFSGAQSVAAAEYLL